MRRFIPLCLLAVLLLVAREGRAEDEAPLPGYHGLVFVGLTPQGAERWLRLVDGATVLRIPRGAFQQRPYEGGAASLPPATVEVESFFLDETEVTNERFARFLDAMTRTLDPDVLEARLARWLAPRTPDLRRRRGGNPEWLPAAGRGAYPVTHATGWGALAYAFWAGGRLPTQSEWEKAAGGIAGRLYPWGDAPPDAQRARFGGPGAAGATAPVTGPLPVGSLPVGAGPYGHLDMAGNVYERVVTRTPEGEERPVMLKGGSWLTPHPLNLRVLDLCMQPMAMAEGSVGFRCAMPDPHSARPTRVRTSPPRLRVRADFAEALEEAQARGVPIFLSLQYDTCGQCDRIRAQLFRDPRFVAYCNEHLVVLVGHQPGDALRDGHQPGPDGRCPFYPDLECYEHHLVFARGLGVVGRFVVSPGNFVLHPDRVRPGAGADAILVGEEALPKWGADVEAYLAAFERARLALARDRAGASPPPGAPPGDDDR